MTSPSSSRIINIFQAALSGFVIATDSFLMRLFIGSPYQHCCLCLFGDTRAQQGHLDSPGRRGLGAGR